MFGANSILKALQDFNKNKNVLNKKPYFDRKKHVKVERADGHESLKFAEADEALIQQIKAEHTAKRRKNLYLLSTIIIIPSCLLLWFLTKSPKTHAVDNYVRSYMGIKSNQKIQKKISELQFFVSDGDAWLLRRHYKNAIFQYKQAQIIAPQLNTLESRLISTYKKACINEGLYCEEWEQYKK
jgi:hypothetical protein